MFEVYILISDVDNSFYIGQTNDLRRRLVRHNAGREKYTSRKLPWKVFWSCEVKSRSEAVVLEKKLKNLKSRSRIINFIQQHKKE